MLPTSRKNQNTIFFVCLLLAIATFSSTDAFVVRCPPQSRLLPSSLASTGDNSNHNDDTSSETSAAQQLLDKAAQLRAEIASMEGKTVEQVTQEAQQKKQDEADRQAEAARASEKAAQERKESLSSSRSNSDMGRSFVPLPNSVDDMIRQAARALERAYNDGKTRQTVRFHLVPFREDGTDNVLEENQWPGGAQQMYREAGKPMTSALLKELRIVPKKTKMTNTKDEDDDDANSSQQNNASSSHSQWMAPNIVEQDIWDFDGSALHTAEANAGPSGDVQALVFPNTDVKYIRDIDEISTSLGPDRLFLLVNPFWRNVDSWSFNLLAPNAKAKAQSLIFDASNGGYEETYVNLVFQVRGEKCIAIKAYPYDWQIFAMREDDYYPNSEYSIRLGSSKAEPTSDLVTKLLNERPEFKETKTMRQFKKL